MIVVAGTNVLPELAPGIIGVTTLEYALFVVALEAHPKLISRHVMISKDNPMYSSFHLISPCLFSPRVFSHVKQHAYYYNVMPPLKVRGVKQLYENN